MHTTPKQSFVLYWMLTLTAVMLSLIAALLVPAERQDRTLRRNEAVLDRVNELQRSLTAVERMLRDGNQVALSAELRNCQQRLDAIRRTMGEEAPFPPALIARRQELEEKTRALIVLGHSGTWEKSASGADDAAIAAVGNFMHELFAEAGARPFPRRGLWVSLYVLVAVTAVLLASIAAAQTRLARRMRSLYDDRHTLMESTPQVLLSFDVHGNAVRWNERLLRETGLDSESLQRIRIIDLFDAAAAPDVVQAVDMTLQRGVFECFLPLLCGGEPKEFSWLFSRNEPEGEDWWITISGYDVSERRLAEQRLRATEERYRDLFAHMREAMFIADENQVIEVNDAMATVSGYSCDELRTMPFGDFYETASDRVALFEALQLQGGNVSDYEIRLRRKDGTVLDCLMSATLTMLPNGGRRFQGVIRDVSEKRRLEDALRRSEADYRGLFENAHDAILVLDPETEIVLDANRRACLLYDFPLEEFIGISMLKLSTDPSRGRAYRRSLEERGTGRYTPFESLQLRRDGRLIEVEIKAAQVMYQGRQAILSINRDVTARKREEQRVRESEERFRLLLESVVDYSIYMVDPDGFVVSWNEGAERISGYSAADVMGRSFAMFYTPEQQGSGAPALDLAAAAESGRLERREQRMRKDGSVFEAAVVLTSVIDERGELRGFAEVTHDITQERRLEETQRQMLTIINNVATEWRKTFDAVTMPVILLDSDGSVQRLNEAAARLAGEAPRALLGRDPRGFGGEPWQVIAGVSDFFREHHVTTEGRAVDEASGRVWQVSTTLVDLDGEERLIVVAYDLTEMTQLEESLRHTQITAALGTLVAGVAHEVRNPLFAITATLDNCEVRFGSSPDVMRYLTPLREEVTRLNELMADLLDYGRPQTLQLDDVSVADVARAAISQSLAAATRQVELRLECDDDLPIVLADRRRLQQVLRNVIDNAIQHSAEGGEVLLRVCAEDSAFVRCEVLDHGPGLSEADLTEVFTPFYSKRNGGTGLGLAIARKLMAAHAGDIAIRNGVPSGAIVTVRIPTAAALPSAEQLDRSA